MDAINQDRFYFAKKIIILLKKLIESESLKIKFRKTDKDFTRNRKLTTNNMIILLLQKGVKSLQIRVNEFFSKVDKMLSNSTFSQARDKLSAEVFNYLSTEIINNFYDKKENIAGYKTHLDYRILAIDGSKIRLPNEEEIQKIYGKIKNINRNNETGILKKEKG